MTLRHRGRLKVLACLLLVVLTACTACTASRDQRSTRSNTTAAVRATPSSSPPASGASPTGAPTATNRLGQLHPSRRQLTRDGLWWGVDSTAPIDAHSLANVRDWYRGVPTPLVWGRYVTGTYRVGPAELAFARAHHIGVYFLVPDSDCSQCNGGGDLCGNDRTADQARGDAREAVRDARRLRLPRGVTLYKDVEQVGSCYGELTAAYLLAWYRYVKPTRYVPAFYGNTTEQSYDFPKAYCSAAAAVPEFARETALAQDEPEPQLGAARHAIGAANAPRFAPYRPRCAPLRIVSIWQYTESRYTDNYTDADEIRPGTHGILAPDGRVT
jgi:hypothetical protein